MRVKRVEKFRRYRNKKGRKLFFFAFIIPAASILIGYLITSLIILPVMAR